MVYVVQSVPPLGSFNRPFLRHRLSHTELSAPRQLVLPPSHPHTVRRTTNQSNFGAISLLSSGRINKLQALSPLSKQVWNPMHVQRSWLLRYWTRRICRHFPLQWEPERAGVGSQFSSRGGEGEGDTSAHSLFWTCCCRGGPLYYPVCR